MKGAVLFLVIFPFFITQAQNRDTTDVQDIYSDLLGENKEDSEDYGLLELLEQLQRNPVDINTADIGELMRIPFISALIANNIIAYRKRHGDFLSVDSLVNIAGIDSLKLIEIFPFVAAGRKTEFRLQDTEFYIRSRSMDDLQLRRGYRENIYNGTKRKLYNRFLIRNSGFFSAGVLTEKDAGENGFADFNSFHLQISPGGIIQQANIGDFTAEFGNGLVIRNPYRISKSASPSSIKSRDINAYTSSGESGFLRGIAVKTGTDNFSLTGFYSRNKIDASVDSLSGYVTALPSDGYHRSAPELVRKDMCIEKSAGVISRLILAGRFSLSFLYYRTSFSPALYSQTQTSMRGSSFRYFSSYYRFVFGNIFLAGEFAYDGNSVASINTIDIDFDRNLSLTASVRNYPHNYFGIHASAFGETGKAGNERGIYFGISYRSSAGRFDIYYDIYKFPAPTYTVSFPSQGSEFQLNYSIRPARRTELKLRYKYEKKEDEIIRGAFREPELLTNQKLRLEFLYSPSELVDVKSRIEFSEAPSTEAKTRERGLLLFQDIRYKPLRNLQLQTRLIFFRTDGYNSRIYEFENDLPGVMSNPALYDSGLRWYLVIRYRVNRFLDLHLKYSETLKPEEKSTGSGYNEIPGNLDNRLSLQLDLNL